MMTTPTGFGAGQMEHYGSRERAVTSGIRGQIKELESPVDKERNQETHERISRTQ